VSVAASVEAPTSGVDDDCVFAEPAAGWTGSAVATGWAAEGESAVVPPVAAAEATVSVTAPVSDRSAALASVLPGASAGRGGSRVSGST
jgi:hypothetical protein